MASSSMSGGGRRPRAEQNRRRNRQRIRRKPLKGGTDHDRRRIVTQEQLEHAHDSNAYDLAMYEASQGAPAPGNRAPSGGNRPSQSSHGHGDRPASQSSGQGSSSKSDEQDDTGSDKSDNETKSQKQASSQPSTPDLPPDIEWSPEDEPSGIVSFAHAAAQGTRDSSEDKTAAVCAALYAADSEAVARGLKIITGCAPDEEQDIVQELTHVLKTIAPDGLFEDEPWFTTRLGPTEPFASSSAEEVPVPDQAQVSAEADGFEQPEVSLLLQWGLTEEFPGENDQSWATKEEVQDFLVADLKRIIPGYDETARVVPGFDETEINWADLTLEESLALYRVEIALELAARAEHYEGFLPPEYDEMKASLDRATKLESLAGPIPLDDTEAYAAAFAGRAYVPDAEHERRHVENQLKLIYDQILGEESDHLATLSTTELKYELYYRLNYDVLPFVKSDEHAIQLQIADFMKDYTSEAGDTPEGAIDRLQGTFRQPDVLGFFFVMGLSIAFEPVDYVLTAVDVIQALSEGDTESAFGNALLGAAPFVSSKLDDLAQPLFRRFGDTPSIADELADAAGVSNRATTSSGSNLIMHADGLISIPNHKPKKHLPTQLERYVELYPSEAWRAKSPHIYEEAHHLVPQGHKDAAQARLILQKKSIPLDSYHNGVALPKHIHNLTRPNDYVKAVNNAILRLEDAPREVIVTLLDDLARKFGDLKLADVDGDDLKDLYQRTIMDWL